MASYGGALPEPGGYDIFLIDGAATLGADLLPPGVRIMGNFKLYRVELRASDAPVGSNLTITIKKNGSLLEAVDLADGETQWVTRLVRSFVDGDILTFDCSAIGSTTPGSYIALSLIGTDGAYDEAIA